MFWQNQITRSKNGREIWKKRENRKKNVSENLRVKPTVPVTVSRDQAMTRLRPMSLQVARKPDRSKVVFYQSVLAEGAEGVCVMDALSPPNG